MIDWTKPEPPPVQTGSAAVWPMVLEDIQQNALRWASVGLGSSAIRGEFINACRQRHEFGVAKYGVPLEVMNGRNPLNDLQDEALDAVAYSRQQYERTKLPEDWELHLMAVQFAARVVQRILETQR